MQAVGVIDDTAPNRISLTAPGIDEPPGASIAVNGCCLTITERSGTTLAFDLLPETLSHTNLGALEPGDHVNLEPALRAGDAMGGHWVQGHIDATGNVRSVAEDATALDVLIDAPERVLRYCVDRGSITVNGVSLTVMGLGDGCVRISLIPETRSRTNLGELAAGSVVNLEADILARYVERLLPTAAT